VPVDRDGDGDDAVEGDVPQLGAGAAVDHAGRQMEQEIDEARRLVAAEQAGVKLLHLRADARQHPHRAEQGIEQDRAHRSNSNRPFVVIAGLVPAISLRLAGRRQG
jgi:hypothetical protein